jgi:acid phosphatase type 7
MKRALAALFLGLLVLPAAAAADQARLESILQDVPSATSYRYGARDNLGTSLDTLKVIDNPQGGYLGVYHALVNGVFQVKLATSTDLLNWTFRTNLANYASQPSIAKLTDGGYVLVYEQDAGCTGTGSGGNCLRFLHYANIGTLLTHTADRSFRVPRTLSSCAEGTPNIYFSELKPTIGSSTIRVGFHYFRNCDVDRQAAGTLTNFNSWSAWVTDVPNVAIEDAGATGNIGDRDSMFFDGVQYRLSEGQLVKGDQSSWRPFLFSWTNGVKELAVHTHRGSTSFANPTFTQVKTPSGAPAVVATMFLPLTGSAPGEAGELIYWKKLTPDPVIAAAGDIACSPGSSVTATACHQQATSDLLVNGGLAGALTLGDNQYEDGLLSAYLSSFDATWGRVKGLIHPAPGNHEYQTAAALGYFDYFDGAGNLTGQAGERGKGYYSFRIGAWRLIALNSNCSAAGGCAAGSPQEQWLKAELAAHPASCTLAFWHHPRFSSGQHGSSGATQALWQDLYDAGADVALVGHDHDYERFAPQDASGAADPARGIREFVVGTGGRSHYSLSTPVANSEVRNSDTFGVLQLTLHPAAYEWKFVPEAGGTFTDSGTGYCH